MLVLSRQRDESICIGENIKVTVVDIRGDKVRLGITASKNVEIDREEMRKLKESKVELEETNEQLQILRDIGFVPYTLAMYRDKCLVEIVSYPYFEGSFIYIGIRLEVGNSKSFEKVLVSDVWTAEALEDCDRPELTGKFLTLISPYLRTRV